MNSRERILSVLNHEMPDRVPVYPKISFATTLANPGVSIYDYENDAEVMAASTIAAYRMFGWDGIAMHTSIAWSGIALGSTYTYPKDDIPHRTACLLPEIGDKSDLEKIVVKNPMDVPVMKTVVDAVSIAKRKVGNETCIMAWVDGPLNIGSQLCPLDALLVGLIDEPEFCLEMFSICTEQSKRYAEALVAAGADIIAFGHATASSSVISRSCYEKFALPFEKRLVAYIHSLGAKVVTHICGNNHNIADLIATNGSDIMDFDSDNDITELMHAAPNMVLRGNISPARLVTCSSDEIDEDCRKVLEATVHFPGYLLSSGCEINLNVPFENMHALVRAAQKYGMR